VSAPDWGVGHYEHTAAQLHPAARVVVDRAAPQPGERVVDVGCGTGNAALLAPLGAIVVRPSGTRSLTPCCSSR
jgi:protein-L-isoaspartate O-methyltransferase